MAFLGARKKKWKKNRSREIVSLYQPYAKHIHRDEDRFF